MGGEGGTRASPAPPPNTGLKQESTYKSSGLALFVCC